MSLLYGRNVKEFAVMFQSTARRHTKEAPGDPEWRFVCPVGSGGLRTQKRAQGRCGFQWGMSC